RVDPDISLSGDFDADVARVVDEWRADRSLPPLSYVGAEAASLREILARVDLGSASVDTLDRLGEYVVAGGAVPVPLVDASAFVLTTGDRPGDMRWLAEQLARPSVRCGILSGDFELAAAAHVTRSNGATDIVIGSYAPVVADELDDVAFGILDEI